MIPPFGIVRIPYRDSNLPSKIFYASIASKMLRLARTSSENLKAPKWNIYKSPDVWQTCH